MDGFISSLKAKYPQLDLIYLQSNLEGEIIVIVPNVTISFFWIHKVDFLLFWFVDALVPWLYQTFVFGTSSIPTAIMLGFFPAVIITLSIRMNYGKTAIQERR